MTIPFVKNQKVRFKAKNNAGELLEFDALAQEDGWTGVATKFQLLFARHGKGHIVPVSGKNIFLVYRDPLSSPSQTETT